MQDFKKLYSFHIKIFFLKLLELIINLKIDKLFFTKKIKNFKIQIDL